MSLDEFCLFFPFGNLCVPVACVLAFPFPAFEVQLQLAASKGDKAFPVRCFATDRFIGLVIFPSMILNNKCPLLIA